MQLTFKRLNEILRYEPKTGKLFWLKNQKIAGTLHKDGYIQIKIDGIFYQAHRLAYMIYNKNILIDKIDHVDGNRSNNIILNLRECSSSENNYNRKMMSNNTSGIKGICWCKREQKWEAKININFKNKFLGYFSNIEDAKRYIMIYREKLNGEFANHG